MARPRRLCLAVVNLSAPLFSAASKLRCFGSAAALQYESDFENEGYPENTPSSGPVPCCSSGLFSERGVKWVLIGAPGANKHVYAEKLSKLLDVPHISMGSLLRHELTPRSALHKQIATAINEGKLVPENVIFGLLSKRLEDGCFVGETGFILDGVPRTSIQAEILDKITDIDLVLSFKCRKDHIEEKFRIYAEQGKVLEEYYRKQKKLVEVQVADAPGDTWQGLLAVLRLNHANSLAHSPQGLVRGALVRTTTN